MGIPFALGFLHLLYAWACWLTLALAGAAALARGPGSPGLGPRGRAADGAGNSTARLSANRERSGAAHLSAYLGRALPVLAVAAVAWPPLVRPLLDGDTLAYHLPSAALWAHDGSLWTNLGEAWWYPGGSELLAAGLLTTAGVLSAGWCGAAALLLLGLRLSEWGEREGLAPWIAGAGAAAIAGSFVFAKQAGALENDVVLAAFFCEVLWAGRFARGALARSAAGCALLKPTGWIYAGTGLAVRRGAPWAAVAAFLPLGLWAVRDAWLWRSAPRAPVSLGLDALFGSSLAGHGGEAVTTLARALWVDGPVTAVLFAFGIVAIAGAADRGLRVAAAVALLIFWFHPFGFNDANPQLANGWSLRYAAPLLALGAVCALGLAARVPVPTARAAGILALVAGGFEVARIWGIYANDATTHATWGVVLALVAVLAVPRQRFRALATGTLGLALVAYSVVLAGSHPLDYYDEWLRPAPNPSRLFEWLAARRAPALLGWGLRVGSLVVASPLSRVVEAGGGDPCAEARRLGALLVVATDDTVPPEDRALQRARGRSCGTVLYDDGAATVVQPAR